MNVIKNFSSVGSNVYSNRFYSLLGKAGHQTLNFSEIFGLKLVKTIDWIAHGFKTNERKFCIELLKAEDTEESIDDFTLNLRKEKEFVDLLIEKGIITGRITWKDRAALIAKIAGNSLLLAATSPVSIPSGGIALGLRACLQNHMNPLTCLTPKFHQTWEAGEELKLFTSNIAGTEFRIMDYINGVTDTKPRIKEWGRFLVQLGPDVICLQEAFDIDEIYPHLAKKLQQAGYYVVMSTKRAEVLGMTSGLFLASRFPIEEVGFHEYTDRMGIDKRAAKGVLTAKIALNDDVKICVATTHMQSGYPYGSEEDRIKWKTEQFNEATKFIDRFNEDGDVRDVFLMGDFNDGRFCKETIDEVSTNYQYPAIIKGVLEKGFKDLTKPNCNESFSDYLKHETEFDHHDPKNVETGTAKGTCFDTAAPSYQQFVELIVIKVSKKLEMPMKSIKRDVKLRLSNIDIGNKRISRIIDDCIEEVTEGMYVKTNVVDHVCFFDKKDNVFDECGYKYKVIAASGPTGILTDHRSLLLTLSVKNLLETIDLESD